MALARLRRWIKRFFFGTFIFVVLAVVTVLIVLHTSWGREKIRAQIQAVLADSFSGGATVGSVEGSVFGTLIVKDVSINGTDRTPMVTVGKLSVAVELLPLLSKRVHVTSLLVENVEVILHPRDPEPVKSSEATTSPWIVEMPDVELRDGAISVEHMGPEPIHIHDLNLRANVQMSAGGKPIVANAFLGARWRERGDAAAAVIASNVTISDGITIPSVQAAVGGALVIATGVSPDPALPVAHVYAAATPQAIKLLANGLVVPDTIAVDASIDGETIAFAGSLGRTTAHAWVKTKLDATLATRGTVFAHVPDVSPFAPELHGAGDVVIALVGNKDGAKGLLVASESLSTVPASTAVVAFDATKTRMQSVAIVGAEGNTRATIASELVRDGDKLAITSATFDAITDDVTAVSMGKLDAKGKVHITAAVAAGGTIRPDLALDVSGTITGRNVAYDKTRVASVDGRFHARMVGGGGVPSLIGSTHLEVRGLSQAGKYVGSAIVDANNRGDPSQTSMPDALGPIDVIVHANHPAAIADVDAVVRLPRGTTPMTIALGKHHVMLVETKKELEGSGGTITVRPDKIVATQIVTTHRGGRVELGATFAPESGNLTANVVAANVAMSLVDPKAKGSGSANIDIARTYGAWSGKAKATATGVQFDDKLSIDGNVTLGLTGRRVSVIANTSLDPVTPDGMFGFSALHGGAEVALEVDGPKDVTDVHAWQMLTRKDLRAGSVTLRSIDAGLFGASGTLDGTVLLSPSDTHGTIEVRGVQTPGGMVNADVSLDNSNGEIAATAKAKVIGVGDATADARIAIPEHLFDPTAWKAMGQGAVREVNAAIPDINVDPDLLSRFGIEAPYRGHAKLSLHIGEGIESARFSIDADGLEGGPIVKSLDLHAIAEMDKMRSTFALDAFITGGGKLVHLDGSIPVTFERWTQGGYAAAKVASLKGNLEIPSTKAAELLAIFGRKDIVDGTLDGKGTLGGTLAVPTAKATIAARDIKVPPHVSGKTIPVMKTLEIVATWGGVGGTVAINGVESDGGRLKIEASGRPDRLAEAAGILDIQGFEIAPIAAFLPGAFVSTSGRVRGHFDVTSFDLKTMHVKGNLAMESGRIPVSPYVGTLRDTSFTLTIDGRSGGIELNGKITKGKVDLIASGDLDKFDASLTLNQVQPITALQPIITGKATAKFVRSDDHYNAAVQIRGTQVLIPQQSGNELSAIKPPNDMVFVDEVTPITKGIRPPPMKPLLVMNLDIGSTRVSSEANDLQGVVHGNIEMSIGDSPQGVAIGMLGLVEADQGLADVFGHRYQLDHANVTFDGTLDAALDVRLIHDFPTLTLMADVGGRISAPVIQMSSEPAQYTEGQLFGFFLGGTPGGDPNSETQSAAAGAGGSIVTQRINRVINKVSPVKIDTFNCQFTETTTTSRSCTIGKWVAGGKIFIAFKPHLEAKPDENANEGIIEYYLRHDLFFEGNVGDRSHHGLDLLWRHRW